MRSFLLLLVVATVALASPASRTVVERWNRPPLGWTALDRADPDQPLELHVFVKQQNTDILERTLLEVSDPRNPRYGQHLTFDEVNDLVRPKRESILAVVDWLQQHGITVEGTPATDILRAVAPVATVERLLQAEYYRFKSDDGAEITRTSSYSIPVELAEHIDFVGPTVRFPSSLRPRPSLRRRSRVASAGGNNATSPNFGVDPTFLRKLYNVGDYKGTASGNVVAVASFLGQFYSSSDLQAFFQQFQPDSSGKTPTLIGPNDDSNPGVEAMLDIEYVMSVGQNVPAQFWSTPGQQPGNPQNEPFLVWLYKVGNYSTIPQAISMSYGDNEDTVELAYAVRVNTEFQKMGVRGVSLTASSGDGGVSGSQPSGCTQFVPTYPAASPWVTAVGGTTSSGPEVAASLSGGGFSNRWARPSYQNDAVQHYLDTATLPDPSRFNKSGAGFPDVAAQAEDFNVVVDGFTQAVDGTSCASPTFIGVVALLNDMRLNAGKSPLGFLNPLFYQNPGAFNDVTSGNNPGCGTNGFSAAEAWDPVTGLGTPNFGALANIIKSLP